MKRRRGVLLLKVWVRIVGLRKELREYMELWAIGSLLGSTQMVDMEITRKNDFGRVLVVVLNPALIPGNLDVVIGDHYFELEFEVEKMGFDENGDEAIIEWYGSCNSEEGEREGAVLQEGEKGQGREAKRQKKDMVEVDGSKGVAAVISNNAKGSFKEQVQYMNEEELEAFIMRKAGEILKVDVVQVMDEMADKAMEEKEEEGLLYGIEIEGEDEHSLEKRVEKMAAVSEANMGQGRSSPRLQRSRDEHTLARAEVRAARKNLEFGEGMLSSNSLLTFDKNIALGCLQQLGISCGVSDQNKCHNVQKLLDSDLVRENLEQGVGVHFELDSDSEEENIEELEINALRSLCKEMMEEVYDETSFPLNCEP
jgi:hypothetical protein